MLTLDFFGFFLALFAPDDEAFAALPAGTVDYLLWPENIDALQILLSYHTHIEVKLAADLSDGDELTTFTSTLGEDPRDLTIGVDDVGTVTVDDFATVTKADILNTNGVAHKINEVLVTDLVDIPSMDIVDTAIANNFTTLVAAVIAAGLESVLRVPNGPYTVFAPTDEAFAALGNETLEYLLLPENVLELKGILESHVADGNVYAEDLVDGMQVTMLNGKNVTIGIGTDTVKVNYATVEAANVMALNGIIHVIDSVLLDEVEFVVEGESTVEISCANGQDSGCDWGEGVSVDWDGGSIGGGGWVPEDETSVLYLENSDMDIEGAYAICSVDCTCVVKDSDGVACLLGGETRPPTMAPVTPPPREDASSVPTETTNLPTSPSAPTSSPTAASPGDIVDVAIANGLTTLVTAIKAAGLEDDLREPNGPYTVFAPSEEAFNKVPVYIMEWLLLPENEDSLSSLLLYHVVANRTVFAADLSDGDTIATINGGAVNVTIANATVKINDAVVVMADVMASNGVIHVIDAVLIPPGFDLPDPPTVVSSVPSSAPTDQYICNICGEGKEITIPDGVVSIPRPGEEDRTCAVLQGAGDAGQITLEECVGLQFLTQVPCGCMDGSSVPTETTNLPTSPSAPTSSPTAASPGDIVDVAIANGLTTLVTAIKAAGLEDDLREPNGPYTVFAPSEEAFNKVPVYIMEWLLLPENEDSLSSLLLYHVVANRTVFAADLSDGDTIATINGGAVNVTIANATVKINDAVVVMADVMASNGVIHVIDAVLIPPGFDLPDPPTGAPTESPVGDIPAELIGEWIGDSKSSSSFVGSCVNATFAQDGSASITVNTDGYCSQVDIEQAPGDTKGGTISRVECMECSGTYGVFGVKDGSGYAERFNEYEEMDTSCGKLVIEGIQSDGISVEQCVLFKTSLLKKTNERRGLRKMEEEEYIVVNTMTEGPLEPSDVACPADIVYDINKFQHVDFALQTTQLVNQDPGNLVDPSNWKCYSSE